MMGAWQPERRVTALAGVVSGALAGAAGAAEVTVEVAGLRTERGTVFAAVCTEARFLRPACAHFGSAPARAGVVAVTGVAGRNLRGTGHP